MKAKTKKEMLEIAFRKEEEMRAQREEMNNLREENNKLRNQLDDLRTKATSVIVEMAGLL